MLVRRSSSSLSLFGVVLFAGAACTGISVSGASSDPRTSAALGSGAADVVVDGRATGPCVSREASRPVPVSPGRGDRVVLATRGAQLLAYVANEDDGAIHTVDVAAQREVAVTPLPGSPAALVSLADGRIAAALRDRNEVIVLEPTEASRPLSSLCRRAVASEPVGLASSSQLVEGRTEERIAVSSGFGHALTILRAHDLSSERAIRLKRDPRAIVAHGGKLFVSHVTSSDVSVVDVATGTVASLDLLTGQHPVDPRFLTSRLPRDASVPLRGGQVFALASDTSGRLYAPMVTVDPGEPKPTSAYGGSDRAIKPFVGVLDLASVAPIPIQVPSVIDDSRGCTLPRAAAAIGDGRLLVACLGIDEVLELDGRANNAAQVVRRRIRVASGPMGLAVAGDRAVVFSQFDRELGVFSTAAAGGELARIPLSRPASGYDAVVERGRKIFHDSFDTRVSLDGRACASCHPDGRDDGNTWSTPDGPRQTITLAGRVAASGPYGWFGEHPSLRAHLHHTMLRLGGQGFSGKDEADLAALEAYLGAMKTPSSDASLDTSRVAAGRALFHERKQGCGGCHAGGGSDGARHDVGSGNVEEARLRFDTPSLQLVSGSGPYFHDGRYATLEELLDESDDRMGHVRHLDAEGRASLVAYMRSLAPPVAPELPVDRVFVAPAAVEAIATASRSPFERIVLATAPPRALSEVVALDLDVVPTVAIAPPVTWDTRREAPQGGFEVASPFVWKDRCAAIGGHAAAFLRLGWRSSGMTRALERCVPAPDADGTNHWVELQAQTVDPRDDGALHVVFDQGFRRHADGAVWITQRIEGDARPVFGGMTYVLRTTCRDCAVGQRDQLHVLTPSDNFFGVETFTLRALSLEAGSASTSAIGVPPWRIAEWSKALGSRLETESRPGEPRGFVLRVDATRGKRDAVARVIVSRQACDAQRSGCG